MSAEVKVDFRTLKGSDLKDPGLTNPLRDFLEIAYGDFWLKDSFDQQTLPNTSEILYLEREGIMEGAIVFNGRRMMMLGAKTTLPNAKAMGYFPGTRILTEGVQTHPDTWATMSSKPEAGSMVDLFARLGFKLIEDLEEIANLYGSLGNAPVGDQFSNVLTEHSVLTRRLGRSEFMSFAHTKSVHDQREGPYFQFAFKNRPE